ncbi:YdeI/OmpD-associated family protein [Peredibacter starrii]|uniref:YdeI/OmpD-associated family protein n=1 Tax=Peredibacter starrii TaxID=28202 RepID=A0AAX4HMG1_9BACT|nr:YdeI/OmpD-associated family protein [Peredibacter starrii]WPU64355.1 YdeI/OmpD-associated family protein [Peredibacter starrii]
MTIKYFKTQQAFRTWLEKNHDKKTEIWIGFYKKDSGKTGITPAQAIDEALCFGWIDGVRQAIDELSYTNRYTPRTKKSKWSKINTENVERLIKLGYMTESGLKAIEEAKADGRWDMAYDSPKNAKAPEDFLKALKKKKRAAEFFKTLNKQNIFAIVYRLQNSKKAETRERWINKIIQMLENGEKFH